MSKCIIILSNKASGSSACQNLLAKLVDIKHVTKTRHFENETLYWTKAASILKMPQKKMLGSEVPIESNNAKSDLKKILADNIKGFVAPNNDKDLIFGGWNELCATYSPIFLEKSPHHLYQWSSLELIMECMDLLSDVEFLLIGLVRNPMDTLYSAYRSWKIPPEKLQYEWLESYRNLQKLKSLVGERLVIIRYEDIVHSVESLNPVFKFCGLDSCSADNNYLHKQSINKWKNDKYYGFNLSDEVTQLAMSYGYKEDELKNTRKMIWPVYRRISWGYYVIKNAFKKLF
jgi:hypothetical protein